MLKRSKETVILENTILPFLNDRKTIKEGLIVTHPIPIAVKVLDKLGYDAEVIDDPFERDYISLDGDPIITSLMLTRVDISNKEKFINLLRTINSLGYYVSTIINPNSPTRITPAKVKQILDLSNEYEIIKNVLVNILIEAKFDIELIKSNLPDKLYHVTTSDRYVKISKIGLTPKSGSKLALHPERVYMAGSIETAFELVQMFGAMVDDDVHYIILEIDTKSFSPRVRIFVDPNAENVVWTYSNIPPSNIKLIKQ